MDRFDLIIDVSFLQNSQERRVDHDINPLIDNKLAYFTGFDVK